MKHLFLGENFGISNSFSRHFHCRHHGSILDIGAETSQHGWMCVRDFFADAKQEGLYGVGYHLPRLRGFGGS